MCVKLSRLLFTFSFIWAFPHLLGQNIPELPHLREDAPPYMQYFNKPLEQININDAIRAYNAYYKVHKFEKNEYSQYYKRFLKWSRQYATTEGRILMPTAEEEAERERKALTLSKKKRPCSQLDICGSQ